MEEKVRKVSLVVTGYLKRDSEFPLEEIMLMH